VHILNRQSVFSLRAIKQGWGENTYALRDIARQFEQHSEFVGRAGVALLRALVQKDFASAGKNSLVAGRQEEALWRGLRHSEQTFQQISSRSCLEVFLFDIARYES
jgi:hypothetical protein